MKHIDQNNSELVLALADKVLAPTYTRPEHLFVEGDGVFLKDAEGQQFLDMTSGVAVNALGHNAEIIKNALRKGLEGLIHTSNLFHTAPAILLANELVQHSFADKVFFTNSGAESVEGAIKFARLYAKDRHEIVYFDSSFHGRTLGALAATDKEKIRTPFTPLPTGYRCAPWNQHVAFNYITAQTAAVIVEPIQGEGGIRFADESWLQALRAHCDKVGALLIFDEVQCGLGRTGTLWGHQHYGITPDLMTRLQAAGIATETLTLHVGAGTFLPVKAQDTADHRMHAEWGSITPEGLILRRGSAIRAAGAMSRMTLTPARPCIPGML